VVAITSVNQATSGLLDFHPEIEITITYRADPAG